MDMKKKLVLVLFCFTIFLFVFSGCTKLKKSNLKANYYLKKAHKNFTDERYKKAAEYYEIALDFNPNLKSIYFYLGFSYSNLFKPARDNDRNKTFGNKALEYLLKARELDPENIHVCTALGDIYFKLGNIEKSEKYYLEVFEKNSDDPDHYYMLANFYMQNRKYKEAEKIYQRRIQFNPEDADGYHYYAGFLQDQRRWSDAISNHEKRLYAKLNSSIISDMNRISDAKDINIKRILKNRLDEKIEQKEKIIPTLEYSKKQKIAEIYYSIGVVCWNWSYQSEISWEIRVLESVIEKGLKNLNKALKIDPDFPYPYAYIGLLYREKAKFQPWRREELIQLNKEFNEKFKKAHKRLMRKEAYRKHLENMKPI